MAGRGGWQRRLVEAAGRGGGDAFRRRKQDYAGLLMIREDGGSRRNSVKGRKKLTVGSSQRKRDSPFFAEARATV